jgi:hypothetical protein
MHIDTSRSRFDANKHYSGVLALQGRVTLDTDGNEQVAIWLYQIRTAVADIVGEAGVPRAAPGFAVARADPTPDKLADLSISKGRMYVDGILVENDEDTTYWNQPDGHLDPDVDQLPDAGVYLVYLRVWEREVTVVQDPDLREVALGVHGPDTTARSQVVWQVATSLFTTGVSADEAIATWRSTLGLFPQRGTLRARARTPDDANTDVCSVSPEAMFRGQENQHYRVELFRSGLAKPPENAPAPRRRGRGRANQSAPPAQFVWSRDNGSDVYAITGIAGTEVTVTDLGRDRRSALDVGDLVEIVDDALIDRLGRDFGPQVERTLFTVTAVDTIHQVVTLDRDPATDAGDYGRDPDLHPLLRRWDAAPTDVEEGHGWLDLEDGVQVQFPGGDADPVTYRSGDFWLVPARRTTGDVIWPQGDHGPAALPPQGIDYHYAPLAIVPATTGADVEDLRTVFNPLIG